MEAINIRHHPDCAKGTWWWVKGEWGPTVSCPSCQALYMIVTPDFKIGHDGRVTPEIICTGCGWRGVIRLLEWNVHEPRP